MAKALVTSAGSQAEILLDPRKLSALVGLAQAGIQVPAQRRARSRNAVEKFANLPVYPVETIRAPTLVIRGTDDKLVPYTHGLFIAELYAIQGGTHAIYATHFYQVLSRLFAFAGAHSLDMTAY